VSALAINGVAAAQTWTDQDVGSVGVAGDHSVANGVWTVHGSGDNIWGTADSFHFVYQQLSGDGQIIAKVDSVQNTSAFAKGGLMIRDGLTAAAAHVVLDLKPGGGTEFMQRSTSGGTTAFIAGTSVATPYWLMLTRSGNTITGYQSSDGNTWTQVGSTTATMSASVSVGVVVCSQNNTQLNTSTFESVSATFGTPTSYNAITDTNPRTKPAPPALGAAGTKITDQTFGSTILRVTDANTRPGSVNKSYRVSSNSHLNVWNSNSTYFYVVSGDGTVIPYSFNAAAMTASRINPVGSGDGGYVLRFNSEPQFSSTDPNVIYGVQTTATHVIRYFNLATGDYNNNTYPTLLDLNTVDPSIPSNSVVGGIGSGGSPENLMAFFGGTSQDFHYDVVWFSAANPSSRHLLNTQNWTIDGAPIAGTSASFLLHSATIDRSGRFVFMYPRNAQPNQVYVWDTSNNAVTAITAAMHPSGHDATGWGYWINEDCCTGGSWDAAQWQFRSLSALATTSNLINPVLTPEVIYMADHESWNNASATNPLVPVFFSTYRYCRNCSPENAGQRAWDDEIIGVDTTHAGSATTVWRFAHHQSDVSADNAAPPAVGFWYEPIATVSPNGLWIVFTSNWGKTLGTDSTQGDPATTHREDVFVVKLTPAGGPVGGPQNVVWTNVVNATATGNSLQKTAGCSGCQDAGGVSQQTIASGTGYVQFGVAAPSGGPSVYVGLGSGLSTPPQASQLAYAFDIWPGGTYDLREFGVWKKDGTWTSTDTFKVSIEAGGVVKYYQNNQLVYQSTAAPGAYPYVLGTTLFAVGSAVNNAVINTP